MEEREVEVTRETPAGLTRDAQQLVGRTLVRGVPAGHPVRLDMVKAATVVQAGDTVRLKIMGSGFAVTAAAQALTAATEGQPVRVRTELGKVLTGTARDGRVVEVAL